MGLFCFWKMHTVLNGAVKILNKKQELIAFRNKNSKTSFNLVLEVPFPQVDLTLAMINSKLWKGLVAKKIDFKLIDLCWRFFFYKYIFNPLITSQTKQNGADKHFTTTAVLHHNLRCSLWCKPTEKRTYLIRCTPLVKKHNVYFPHHFTQAGVNNCFLVFFFCPCCCCCCFVIHTYILYLWAKNWVLSG